MKVSLRKILVLAVTACLLLLIGCNKKKLIPNNHMVDILTEVFITDAMVNAHQLSAKYSKKDSIEYYKPIYTRMGYTENQFNNTINYLIDNPSELEKLLDKVVNNLSKLETELAAQKTKVQEDDNEKDDDNLWDKKTRWLFPRDGKHETLEFKIPISEIGVYTLSAEVKVNRNDESIEPEMDIWLLVDERKGEETKFSSKSQQYIKDGVRRTISLSIIVRDTTYTHIYGYLFNHKPQEGEWNKSAEIRNITIKYHPLPSSTSMDRFSPKADTSDISR